MIIVALLKILTFFQQALIFVIVFQVECKHICNGFRNETLKISADENDKSGLLFVPIHRQLPPMDGSRDGNGAGTPGGDPGVGAQYWRE